MEYIANGDIFNVLAEGYPLGFDIVVTKLIFSQLVSGKCCPF
jgi:hypothetical protein